MKKIFFVFCVFAAFFSTSCSSTVTTSIAGVVKDRDGRPIQGAEVLLYTGSSLSDPKAPRTNATTGVNGAYQITLQHASSEKLSFSVKKSGYRRVHIQNFTYDTRPKGSNEVVLE